MTRLHVSWMVRLSFITLLSVVALGASGCGKKGGKTPGINIITDNDPALVIGVTPPKGLTSGATEITILGVGFVDGATVTVGGNACEPVTFVSSTEIRCTTSANSVDASNVAVVVTNPGTIPTTLDSAFTYQAAPEVSSISPDSGALAGGTEVTISGSALSADSAVTIGGVPCENPVVNASQTELTCTIATGTPPVGGDIIVTNPGADPVTADDPYTFLPPPNITLLDKTAGTTYGGFVVTITGTDFVDGATVTFDDDNECSNVIRDSATQLRCTVPANESGAVSVTVTNPDSQADTVTDAFTYKTVGSVAQTSAVVPVTVNPTTLAVSALASVDTSSSTVTAIHPTLPMAYIAYAGKMAHFAINRETGAFTSTGAAIDTQASAVGGLVMHPTGKWMYVTNRGLDNSDSYIQRININPTTGLLTAGDTYLSPTGESAWNVTASPNGNFLLVVYDGNSKVSSFSINATTGALTHAGTYDTQANPRAVAVDSTSTYLYVSHNGVASVSGYNINSGNGTLTLHGSAYALTGAALGSVSITVDSIRHHVYVGNTSNHITIFDMNAVDGSLSAATNLDLAATGATTLRSLVTNPTNDTLNVVMGSGSLLTYDIGADGSLSGPDILGGLTSPRYLAFTRY